VHEKEDVMNAGPAHRFVLGATAGNGRASTMWLLLLATAGCFGCSFVLVTGPPSEPPSDPREPVPECTTSELVPMLDSIGAVLSGVSMVVVVTADRGEDTLYAIEMEQETAIGVSAAQLAAFGAGAVYGFIQTSRCRSYREEMERAQRPTWSPALAPGSGPSSPPTGDKAPDALK
jgi:hypothetical protein